MSLRWIILIAMVFVCLTELGAQTVDYSVERDKRTYIDRGGVGDGFIRWSSEGISLKSCPDRYITAGESVTVRVESNATSFKWYRDGSFISAGGKSYTDSPITTTVYKVVAQLGAVTDSCFITVHVVDRFQGGAGDGYSPGELKMRFLNGGGQRYIAKNETIEIQVESHTDNIKWYDGNGGILATSVKNLLVAPEETTVYKAVAQDGSFKDSCYITVHVKDNFKGDGGDGMDWSKPPTYLYGCGNRFIAKAEASELYVESHTNRITWYDESGNRISTLPGRTIIVHPDRTTSYKAVAEDGEFKDSCYITVHVRDNFAGNPGDGFDASDEATYLTGGSERFIAAHENVIIKVWSHTQDVLWYDGDGVLFPEIGRNINVSPLKTTTYMAVVNDGLFRDSCYVTVHVNDNFAGEVADGFASLYEDVLYLKGGTDRYIAKNETVDIGVEAHTRDIKWYREQDNFYVGAGKMVPVSPDTTTVYKAVANLGERLDSCYVTVHVNDNFTGEIADGYSKSCGPPRVLQTIAVKGQPCSGTEGIKMSVICFERDAVYKWQRYDSIRKVYAALPDSLARDVIGADSSTMIFKRLRPAFNGVYRCVVDNSCGAGTTLSDSLLLHVNRCMIDAEMVPDTVELCRGEQKKIAVNLLDGVAPWQYTYRTPGGTELTRMVDRQLSDTIVVDSVGIYQLVLLKDGSGDIRMGAENLPKILVKQRTQPEATISGPRDELCWGEEASVSIKITEGVGPWKVWILRDDNQLADEVVANPVNLTGRDTVIRFMATETMTYHIGGVEDYFNGVAICDGTAVGMAAVNVRQVEPVRFQPVADNHFGQCSNVNLFTLLQPKLGDRPVALGEGKFYVDSVALADDWWGVANSKAGCHKIYYELNTGNCVAASPEITLCIDSVTVNAELSKKHVCMGDPLSYEITLGDKGYTFTWQNIRVGRNGVSVPTSLTETLNESMSSTKQITWLSGDSCQIFALNSVTDRHGCSGYTRLPLLDTVYNHIRPSFGLLTRSGSTSWSESATVSVREGEPAYIRGQLKAGVAPWTLWGKQVTPSGGSFGIHSNGIYADTILKKEGLYCFQAEDKYCANWMDEKCVFVNYVKSAYVRLKVLLEGPYDNNSARMTSSLQNVMPRYFGMDRLPVENSAIDWIEIELRQGKSSRTPVSEVAELSDSCNIILRDTCLLLADGTVVDRHGNTKIEFSQGLRQSEKCYIVLRHRNHLATMTNKPYIITTSADSVVLVDFTDSSTVYMGTENLSQTMSVVGVRDGKQIWALGVGEVNENAIVSLLDPNDVKALGLQTTRDCGYNILDVNFDGKVNWPGLSDTGVLPDDWIRSRMNRDKHTKIRFKDRE